MNKLNKNNNKFTNSLAAYAACVCNCACSCNCGTDVKASATNNTKSFPSPKNLDYAAGQRDQIMK